ncbi:unnamed protein product [Closterium sp. NIES-54]
MGPPLANVQLAPSSLLSRSRQVGHVATNGKQATTTSAARFALVVNIPVRCPVTRHGFVPRSARGERAIYRGEHASSAQPVTCPVTQQHAQPRVAAAYDRAHPRTAVCASTSSRRQHLREQQLTLPPPSLPQLPPWGEGDVGVAGVSCLQPVLPLPSAGSAVRGGERLRGEGEGKRGECERVAREILQSQQPPLLSLSLPLVLLWGGG